MNFWFSEPHTKHVRFQVEVEKQMFSRETDYQRIDLYTSPEFGKVLVLDGSILLTEKDEFIYHEMIAHVPMAVHPNVRRVLIIGGGDGGTLREICRYPEIERIDLVEMNACQGGSEIPAQNGHGLFRPPSAPDYRKWPALCAQYQRTL